MKTPRSTGSKAKAASELSGINRFLAPAAADANSEDAPTQLTAPPADCVADDEAAPTVISALPSFTIAPPAPDAPSSQVNRPVMPATAPVPAPAAPAPAEAPINLDEVWPAQPPKRKREIPRKAIGVAGLLLVLIVLSLYCSRAAHQPSAAIGGRDGNADDDVASELVVSERDLKHRVPVTADYFRSRRAIGSAAAPPLGAANAAVPGSAVVPPPPSADADDDAAADRKRRDDDPEDLVSHRHRAAAANKTESASTSDEHRRPFLYYPSGATAAAAAKSATSSSSGNAQTIAPAGTTVSASLVTPVNLLASGGTANVIAKVDSDGAVPRGSRLVGAASAEDGARLTIRFSRLLLPDDREAKLDAEAQDDTGAFGVAAVYNGNRGARAKGVAGDVAAGAATDTADAVLGTFTGGLTGGILRSAADRASSRRGAPADDNSSSAARLTLAAGTHFNVFFQESAVERR